MEERDRVRVLQVNEPKERRGGSEGGLGGSSRTAPEGGGKVI